MEKKLIRYIFIKEGLLEDIKIFIYHDLELGLVTRSCEYV